MSARLMSEPLFDAADFEASPSGFLLPRPPKRAFTLTIETRLDPAANTKLMGLYRTGSAYCTQCEAEGFPGRITYFLDRPDVLDLSRAPRSGSGRGYRLLLSNGNLEAAGEAETPGRHFCNLARSAQEAVLPVCAGRRRSRPYRGSVS